MEHLNIQSTTPVANQGQVVSPAPMTPSVESTPMPSQPTPQVQMAEGGNVSSDGGAGSFFKNLNWMEVIITTLGVTALFWTIHYYSYKSKEDKMVNNQIQRQIDEIKMNLMTLMKGKYKSI